MPIHPIPNFGVTVRAGISFWEVITGLNESCDLDSAPVWALALASALVPAMTFCFLIRC